MQSVFHDARLCSRHARSVPQCTLEFSFHNAWLQFSSCTLCSRMHGSVIVMHAMFHVAPLSSCLTIHDCISRHARCVPQCIVAVLVMQSMFHNAQWQFSSCKLCSTMHRYISRHAHCLPQCTVEVFVILLCSTINGWVLVIHAVFHIARLMFRSTMHRCSSHHNTVFHNAWLSSRQARCVPQCTVEFSIHITRLQFLSCMMCTTVHG